MKKDDSLITFINAAKERCPISSFKEVDYWDADMCATGFEVEEAGILIYLCTFETELGFCNFTIETTHAIGCGEILESGTNTSVSEFCNRIDHILASRLK